MLHFLVILGLFGDSTCHRNIFKFVLFSFVFTCVEDPQWINHQPAQSSLKSDERAYKFSSPLFVSPREEVRSYGSWCTLGLYMFLLHFFSSLWCDFSVSIVLLKGMCSCMLHSRTNLTAVQRIILYT